MSAEDSFEISFPSRQSASAEPDDVPAEDEGSDLSWLSALFDGDESNEDLETLAAAENDIDPEDIGPEDIDPENIDPDDIDLDAAALIAITEVDDLERTAADVELVAPRRDDLPTGDVGDEENPDGTEGLIQNDEGLIQDDEGLIQNDEGLIQDNEGLDLEALITAADLDAPPPPTPTVEPPDEQPKMSPPNLRLVTDDETDQPSASSRAGFREAILATFGQIYD